MSGVYHLGLDEGKIEEARFAFLPGDPDRVKFIAQNFDSNSKEIAYKREYRSCLGKMKGKSVLATCIGMGGLSTSIAVEELAQLEVKTFIRISPTWLSSFRHYSTKTLPSTNGAHTCRLTN